MGKYALTVCKWLPFLILKERHALNVSLLSIKSLRDQTEACKKLRNFNLLDLYPYNKKTANKHRTRMYNKLLTDEFTK